MRKIALTGLAVLSIMIGGIVPAEAATTPAKVPSVASAPVAGTVSPAPFGSKVSCASPTSCLAVSENDGSAGNATPAADAWNGTAWNPLAVPVPKGAGGALTGVSCKPGACLALGYYSTKSGDYTLALRWNGKTLTRVAAPPMPAGALDGSPGDVSCVSAISCVMIGSAVTSAGRPQAVIDTWNGAKWTMHTAVLPGAPAVTEFIGLSCVSASYCVAGGMSMSMSSANPNSPDMEPLLASWNGKALTAATAPAPRGAGIAMITGVSCLSTVSCAASGFRMSTATGASYGFADVLTGKTWAATAIVWPKGSGSSMLLGVSCASSRNCVAVGGDGIASASTANTGRAAAVSYNGKAWTVQQNVPLPARGTVSMFSGVACVSAAKCVAAGLAGQVRGNAAAPLNGVWNGASWKLFRLP